MLLAASVGLVLSAKGSDAPTAKVFAAAVLLAAFFQQLAFIGHDTGHQTLCVDREKDDKFGLAWGNMLTGVSIAWWKASHYVHHAVPNSVEHDPDIAHMPVFAVTPSFFDDIYHSFHSRVMPFDWAARTLFIPYQHCT
jgi:delta8-fatty-acid desaturase